VKQIRLNWSEWFGRNLTFRSKNKHNLVVQVLQLQQIKWQWAQLARDTEQENGTLDQENEAVLPRGDVLHLVFGVLTEGYDSLKRMKG
jgi:hypothetical protein